jgi:hypothetical protein
MYKESLASLEMHAVNRTADADPFRDERETRLMLAALALSAVFLAAVAVTVPLGDELGDMDADVSLEQLEMASVK